MPDRLTGPDTLDAVLDDIWQRWRHGSADRRSPFHTPLVASIDSEQCPQQRVMVLRHVDHMSGRLRFHTDRRSAKVGQLGARNAVSVTGYDAAAKIQLRARGSAVIACDGAEVDAAWASTSPSGRRSYMTIDPPGSRSDHATTGLPPRFEATIPTLHESDVGRANFALVTVAVDRLEWLHLASTGHRRAAFLPGETGWCGDWLVP